MAMTGLMRESLRSSPPLNEWQKQRVGKAMKRLAKHLDNVMPTSNPHNSTYWPYQARITEHNSVREIERWCYAHFKSKNWRNSWQWFAFKREEDYVMFALRWL
jgi:hypothetical protein